MKFYFVDGEIKKYIVNKIETFIDWTPRLATCELNNWTGNYDKNIYLELFHHNLSQFSDLHVVFFKTRPQNWNLMWTLRPRGRDPFA